MKFFPRLPLRKPSLPLSIDMPIREVDVRATWNGDVFTPLNVEIVYQFNAPSYMLEPLFQHDHPAVVDWEIEYLDGHVHKYITKNSETLKDMIDSALGSSGFPSPRIAPSPTPSSIADLPWTHITRHFSDSTYSHNVSSAGIPSSPLDHHDPIPDLKIPKKRIKLPDTIVNLPCTPGGHSNSEYDPFLDLSPIRPSPASCSSFNIDVDAIFPPTPPPQEPLITDPTDGFEDCSNTISQDLDVTPSQIIIHNRSPSFHHIRMIIRASILVQPAPTRRGFVFSVPGLAQFFGLGHQAATGFFTLLFTDSAAFSGWHHLSSDHDVVPFSDVASSCAFEPREGYSLRLLRTEDLPVWDGDIHAAASASVSPPASSSVSSSSAVVEVANQSESSPNCLSRRSATCAAIFTLLTRVLSTILILWILSRAFAHESTLALEERALATFLPVAVAPAPAPPSPPPQPPPPPPTPQGPETWLDHIDYFLGWKGPDGSWA